MQASNRAAVRAFRQRVRQVVDTVIQPYLRSHGGGVTVREFRGTDVGLVLTGNCAGCPASQITMEEVVAKILHRYLGKAIGRVYLINETDVDVLAFAKKLMQHPQSNENELAR